MNIKHFIITRFMSEQFNHSDEELFNESFLIQSYNLMKNHLLQTLSIQTNKNFELIILIHDRVPLQNVKFLYELEEKYNFPITIKRSGALKEYINTFKNQYDFVITSRIDYDDHIYKCVVDDTQKRIDNKYAVQLYGLLNGVSIIDNNTEAHFMTKNYNNQGFFSVFETLILNTHKIDKLFSIYDLGNHTKVCETIKKKYREFDIPNINAIKIEYDKCKDIRYIWIRHKNSQSVLISNKYHCTNNIIRGLNLSDFGYTPKPSDSLVSNNNQEKSVKRSDVQIFVLCYKKVNHNIPDNSLYTPLQCGASVFANTDLCKLKDNCGDNISERNEFYAEVTGTYFLWKNKSKDYKYIGQTQYRRQLILDESTDFDEIFKKYDVILPKRLSFQNMTVFEQYALHHNHKDLELMWKIITNKFPEYSNDFKTYILEGNELFAHSGLIMRSEDFDKYCKFLFTCINEHSKICGIKNVNDMRKYILKNFPKGRQKVERQKFLYGFLAERLLTLFIFHNFKNIMEMNYTFYDVKK